MIEQESVGLLYLVNLNHTSFEQNPGRFSLPKGRYVAEVRDGVFDYKNGYSADVGVKYVNGGKKKILKFPDLGTYKDKESALNAYLGMSVQFDHDGGNVEIYNTKASKRWFGKMKGKCVIGVWDGKLFGSPSGVFEPQECTHQKDMLILTNNPKLKPYKDIIDANIDWQSDLSNYGKYRILVLPPESYSFLYKIRDNNCLDTYVKSGGSIYLSGFSVKYLSYYNTLPFNSPWYLGDGKFNSVATSFGNTINIGGKNYIKFQSSLTIPVVQTQDAGIAYLKGSNIEEDWCAMKRKENGNGKIVWSSFFIMNHENTENWNKLVLKQIEWLLK